MISRILFRLVLFATRNPKLVKYGLLAVLAAPFAGIAVAKFYQNWDDDPERGAISVTAAVVRRR